MIVFLSKLWGYNFSTFSSGCCGVQIIFEACLEFFINIYACRKNELKIMIVIFKNLLAYPTLVVWNLITILRIGLVSL